MMYLLFTTVIAVLIPFGVFINLSVRYFCFYGLKYTDKQAKRMAVGVSTLIVVIIISFMALIDENYV